MAKCNHMEITTMTSTKWIAAVSATLILALASVARADTVTWIAGNGVWQNGDGTSWTGGDGVFNNGDEARFTQGGTYAVTIHADGVLPSKLYGRYLDSSAGVFNGTVTGDYLLTAEFHSGSGYGWYGRITGPGFWDIAGFVKTESNGLKVYAPEIFGDVLIIDAGAGAIGLMNVSDSQSVSLLSLGGVEETAPGTYGATGSGTDYIRDAYFQGPGVVTLAAPVQCTSCPDYLPEVLAAICDLPDATSAAAFKQAVIDTIGLTVEAPICWDGQPGEGSEANCEAHLTAAILNDAACAFLQGLFD